MRRDRGDIEREEREREIKIEGERYESYRENV